MKRNILVGMLVIVLSLILSACTINLGHNIGINRAQDVSDKTVSGGKFKSLEVSSPVGSVKVNKWDKNDLYIKVTKVNNGLGDNAKLLEELKNVEILYKEEGEKLIVKALLPKFKDNGISVDFEISIPKDIIACKVESDVGDVRLSGVDGQIDVVNNVGRIEIERSIGRMNLRAMTGDVSVREGSLKGDCVLVSNAGRVMFDGTIDNQGSYSFTTNVGKVDITLPSSTAFEIDASANVGNINCGFNVSGNQNSTGIRGKVNGGGPKLTIVNNVGNISINKR